MSGTFPVRISQTDLHSKISLAWLKLIAYDELKELLACLATESIIIPAYPCLAFLDEILNEVHIDPTRRLRAVASPSPTAVRQVAAEVSADEAGRVAAATGLAPGRVQMERTACSGRRWMRRSEAFLCSIRLAIHK